MNIRETGWHLFEEDIVKALADVNRKQQCVNEILSERTGQTIEEIEKACREAKVMTSEEELEFGLIDEII